MTRERERVSRGEQPGRNEAHSCVQKKGSRTETLNKANPGTRTQHCEQTAACSAEALLIHVPPGETKPYCRYRGRPRALKIWWGWNVRSCSMRASQAIMRHPIDNKCCIEGNTSPLRAKRRRKQPCGEKMRIPYLAAFSVTLVTRVRKVRKYRRGQQCKCIVQI